MNSMAGTLHRGGGGGAECVGPCLGPGGAAEAAMCHGRVLEVVDQG